MSTYLRLTPADFRAVRQACRLHTFVGSYADFRRFLVEALRESHPELAAWVGGLGTRQVRTMRIHLEAEAKSGADVDGGSSSRSGTGLQSQHNWRNN